MLELLEFFQLKSSFYNNATIQPTIPSIVCKLLQFTLKNCYAKAIPGIPENLFCVSCAANYLSCMIKRIEPLQKKNILLSNKHSILFSLIALFLLQATTRAQIGMGTTTPDSSAIVHIQDSTRGLLIPRMTAARRIAITRPAEGLMVYQTDAVRGFWYFTNGRWTSMVAAFNGGKHTLTLTGDITDAQAQAKIAAEVGPNTQEVRIVRCNNLVNVNLSVITSLTEIYVTDNPVLQSINIQNITAVDGGVYIDNCPQLTTVNGAFLKNIGQAFSSTYGLEVKNSGLTNLNFPQLTSIAGKIYLYNNSALSAVSFPKITRLGEISADLNTALSTIDLPLLNQAGDFSVTNNYNITSVNLPVLNIAQSIVISNTNQLTSLTFPGLVSIDKSVFIYANAVLSDFSMPALSQVPGISLQVNPLLLSVSLPVLERGDVSLLDNTAVTGVSLPFFTTGNFSISGSPSLADISLPFLTSGGVNITGPSLLTTVSLPSLAILSETAVTNNTDLTSFTIDAITGISGNSLNLSGNKLPTAQVNYILHQLAGITPTPEFKIFTLTQSVAAPPTGQGITDRGTLIAAPNTVITD